MPRQTSRALLLASIVSAASVLCIGDALAAPQLAPYYVGASACQQCHEYGQVPGGAPVVCTCKEAGTWLCRDKHQDAFNGLDVTKNPRAAQMAKILWPHADPMKEGPQQRQECLSCHSAPGENPKERPAERFDDSFKIEEGVTCVTCHGAHKEWVTQHGILPAQWRKQSREEKQSKYGMTDLWNPERRMDVCGSCHIGNAEQHKVVTHAMYAAGHPPLPSFEIGSAGERLPRHWQLVAQKTPEVRKLLFGEQNADPAEYEETKVMIVGAAASFRQSMKLLAAEAAEARDAGKGTGAIDFAQMDCAACHHDLKVPSWRQERGYAGAPGRPGLRTWPMALLPVAVALADGKDEKGPLARDFQAKKKRLYDAFGARPYGDAQQVENAAKELVDWSDALVTKLKGDTVKYDADTARAALRQIVLLPATQAPDYDAARQTGWAFRVVYGELLVNKKAPDDGDVKKRLDDLDGTLELDLPKDWYPKPWEFTLPQAGDEAKTKVRNAFLDKCREDRWQSYKALIPAVMSRQADYDPDKFRAAFAELAKMVESKPAP